LRERNPAFSAEAVLLKPALKPGFRALLNKSAFPDPALSTVQPVTFARVSAAAINWG
jgi:hypothetical protein